MATKELIESSPFPSLPDLITRRNYHRNLAVPSESQADRVWSQLQHLASLNEIRSKFEADPQNAAIFDEEIALINSRFLRDFPGQPAGLDITYLVIDEEGHTSLQHYLIGQPENAQSFTLEHMVLDLRKSHS
jgi:hypothetical protein